MADQEGQFRYENGAWQVYQDGAWIAPDTAEEQALAKYDAVRYDSGSPEFRIIDSDKWYNNGDWVPFSQVAAEAEAIAKRDAPPSFWPKDMPYTPIYKKDAVAIKDPDTGAIIGKQDVDRVDAQGNRVHDTAAEQKEAKRLTVEATTAAEKRTADIANQRADNERLDAEFKYRQEQDRLNRQDKVRADTQAELRQQIRDMQASELDRGNTDRAIALRNLERQPTPLQLLELALQYADNPSALKVLYGFIGQGHVVNPFTGQNEGPSPFSGAPGAYGGAPGLTTAQLQAQDYQQRYISENGVGSRQVGNGIFDNTLTGTFAGKPGQAGPVSSAPPTGVSGGPPLGVPVSPMNQPVSGNAPPGSEEPMGAPVTGGVVNAPTLSPTNPYAVEGADYIDPNLGVSAASDSSAPGSTGEPPGTNPRQVTGPFGYDSTKEFPELASKGPNLNDLTTSERISNMLGPTPDILAKTPGRYFANGTWHWGANSDNMGQPINRNFDPFGRPIGRATPTGGFDAFMAAAQTLANSKKPNVFNPFQGPPMLVGRR